MDPRGNMECAVRGVHYLGCMGRLEEFGLAGVAAADRGYVHDAVYQLQLVEKIQGHQAGSVHRLQLGGCDRLCARGGVFHQSVYNGEKIASSVNGAGKTGRLHVKE